MEHKIEEQKAKIATQSNRRFAYLPDFRFVLIKCRKTIRLILDMHWLFRYAHNGSRSSETSMVNLHSRKFESIVNQK